MTQQDGSGIDYFLARYYTSGLCRFTTPDWSAQIVPVPYANMGDPQSLNLYAYVGNDPNDGQDPNGHARYDGRLRSAVGDYNNYDESEMEQQADFLQYLDVQGETNSSPPTTDTSSAPASSNSQNHGTAATTAGSAQQTGKWNTVTLNLGGVKVNVRYMLYRRGTTGGTLDITATPKNCPDCRWGQVINAYDGNGNRKDGGSPGTPLYGNRGKGDNVLYDTPSRSPSGQFTGTGLLGFASKVPGTNGNDTNVFSVFGAFTYGFNAGSNGNLRMTILPTATSPSEGVNTLQQDTPGWIVQ